MGFSFLPKETKFFDLLDQQTCNLQKAAAKFRQLAKDGKFDEEGAKAMREIEQEGDTFAHEITDALNRTFITPLDREDIFALAHEIDDIVDYINSTTTRMKLYKLTTPVPEMQQFGVLFEDAVNNLCKAVTGLREISRPRRILDYCIEVNRLENAGDQLKDAAVEKLFDQVKDPITLIKWKEIFEVSEVILDKCEHVAKIIESIVVKQS
ncbi:MAG: DUF47 domain-containing protein [Elusimicrobia bacterium]|nr:DUF47 domain-containing protein [Elusimicrobiota bacterium]